MSLGIVGYGAYLPAHRLDLAEVAATLGTGSGRGSRVVASFDEDSTTMAVAAARGIAPRAGEALWFATASPAYAEKTNAAAVHTALGLGGDGFAVDVAGSPRCAQGALRAAGAVGGLAVLADVRVGMPGSADEARGADGAAAFRFGPESEALAVPVARACATAELLDRWRLPSELTASQWEERFGLDSYAPLVATTAGRALADAGLASTDLVVVSSPHPRVTADALARLGGADALPMGNAGAADVGIRLADALDRAQPGSTILVVSVSDGVVATVWQATDRIDGDAQARL